MRLARSWQTHAVKHEHSEPLPEHGRVLPQVVEHERFETEELLICDVVVEINSEAWLGIASTRPAAHANPGVADLDTPPFDVGRVIHVFAVGAEQLFPIPGI